ncbi:MAG: trypsin-like peptidase domain-containing protein [Gammaproteobacteria bacterium]|nr:trypsin-like peptidase domain-containing protein [Gammaproteobacteria bacterium]
MRRVFMALPWFLLVVVIAWFWHLKEQWRKHPETLAVQSSEVLVSGAVSSYHNAVKAAAPAVVNIYTTQKVRAHRQIDDPVLRRFFEFHEGNPQLDDSERAATKPTSLGSGVITTSNGYILTNNHVVAQADKIIVALQDGRRAEATVIGTDPDSDLAVIKINLTNLPILPFRKNPTEVGDIVLAIGNPFGVGQTVTHGIVSATGRSGLGINAFEDFIQTDAAINPGNSGGALVDVAGNLVGINTAIFSQTGGSMGIGFAIPATLAQQVMMDIIQKGKVTRGWLGIEVGNQDDLTGMGDDVAGVRVVRTLKNGPADRSGLKSNDVILSMNDVPVSTAAQLIQRVAAQKPSTSLNLLVKRGHQQIKLAVAIGERPPADAKNVEDNNANANDGDPSLFGLFNGQ